MGTYFKPLRRKIGCVTLVLACVFAAGWVRSFTCGDTLLFASSPSSNNIVHSIRGNFFWMSLTKVLPEHILKFPKWTVADNIHLNQILQGIESDGYHRHWSLLGFATFRHPDDRYSDWKIIPYWSIVIPLTLISAWLLLSKPRVAKPKPITEPIPEKLA